MSITSLLFLALKLLANSVISSMLNNNPGGGVK